MASSRVTVEFTISDLTGLPVLTIADPGKKTSIPSVATITALAFLASNIFDFPAKEFASCKNVGILFCWAYFKTGKLE
jgi:hypothetical protein